MSTRDGDRKTSQAALAIHAAAAGASGAMPVPLVDTMLAGLARGAAMRRVAARHGVRLSRDARAVLVAPPKAASKTRSAVRVAGRMVREVVARAAAPFRVGLRAQQGVETFAAALLFDHYLATANRARESDVSRAEAELVRAAIETALRRGALDALRDAPRGFWSALVDAVRAARLDDDENRPVVERTVDALLDAAATAPTDLVERLEARFDEALRKGALDEALRKGALSPR